MDSINSQKNNLFNLTFDENRIVNICAHKAITKYASAPLIILEEFAATVIALLEPSRKIAGIIYQCPFPWTDDFYQSLFKAAREKGFESRLQTLLDCSSAIHQAKIPIVAVVDQPINSIQIAPLLWGHYIIGTENTELHIQDCSFGIFPGLGITVYGSRRLTVNDIASLLIKGVPFNSEKALTTGLINQVAADMKEALIRAADWILSHPQNNDSKTESKEAKQATLEALDSFKKKANSLFPGISCCLELLDASKNLSLEKALQLEAQNYTAVLKNPLALAIMRTMYYGVKTAQQPQGTDTSNPIQKVGVIGAGMMGSGIAYEVAKAGISVYLKDTSLELAQKGRQYTEKCCNKLISLGKMTDSKKQTMLSLIRATDNVRDLHNADIIIEAVFEQEQLKAEVIKESEPFMKPGGIFASNTTSLPISGLSANSIHPENFIGMHFFSPVDRMALVEIIVGRQTSNATLTRAKTLALQLKKIPIVVHDSPAFFTSRIFFNYLLEAVTMILEGIPAAQIEKEAINAGFAIGPLAVLDEISLPLMLHVYDQLPQLSESQHRCYNYLKKLIEQNRAGRKSGKGFYDYDRDTGKKQILEDESLAITTGPINTVLIRKRLLHVMALDSYRCLDEGVLDQPIDGDIGSVMGVGYPAHTGGAIAHIDHVGIQAFVQDCLTFRDYGQQWQLPASLLVLAEKEYTFYKDFKSNWPAS